MSLINDALKRARQAQVQSAAQPCLAPLAAPPLSPVEYSRHSAAPLWVLPASGILAACALLLLIHWWRSTPVPEVQANLKSPPQTAGLLEPTVPSSAVEFSTPVEPASNPALSISPAPVTDLVAPAVAEPVALTAQPIDEAPQSELQLQGIFYRGSKPIALINDQTVTVGDHMESALVLAITRQTVTVVQGSRTNVLSLR
jgi:hypothetical protein